MSVWNHLMRWFFRCVRCKSRRIAKHSSLIITGCDVQRSYDSSTDFPIFFFLIFQHLYSCCIIFWPLEGANSSTPAAFFGLRESDRTEVRVETLPLHDDKTIHTHTHAHTQCDFEVLCAAAAAAEMHDRTCEALVHARDAAADSLSIASLCLSKPCHVYLPSDSASPLPGNQLSSFICCLQTRLFEPSAESRKWFPQNIIPQSRLTCPPLLSCVCTSPLWPQVDPDAVKLTVSSSPGWTEAPPSRSCLQLAHLPDSQHFCGQWLTPPLLDSHISFISPSKRSNRRQV